MTSEEEAYSRGGSQWHEGRRHIPSLTARYGIRRKIVSTYEPKECSLVHLDEMPSAGAGGSLVE
eukprot:4576487-Pyramimonas_sp.AAC.1